MHSRPLRILLFIFFLAVSAQAQENYSTSTDAAATSYGFVSPNTEENLSLEDAIRKLTSREQVALLTEIRLVGCEARLNPLVLSSIGSWSDGAENSTLFKTSTDDASIRYAVAKLGKGARQKAVLYFRERQNGTAQLYILYSQRRGLRTLSKLLDKAGIAFRTLVPLKNRTLVYVIDLEGELREKIPTAARLLRAKVRNLRGDASFIGNDEDRQKAQTVFEAEIKMFESTRGSTLQKCNRRGSPSDAH
jgi:hypothetical protein